MELRIFIIDLVLMMFQKVLFDFRSALKKISSYIAIALYQHKHLCTVQFILCVFLSVVDLDNVIGAILRIIQHLWKYIDNFDACDLTRKYTKTAWDITDVGHEICTSTYQVDMDIHNYNDVKKGKIKSNSNQVQLPDLDTPDTCITSIQTSGCLSSFINRVGSKTHDNRVSRSVTADIDDLPGSMKSYECDKSNINVCNEVEALQSPLDNSDSDIIDIYDDQLHILTSSESGPTCAILDICPCETGREKRLEERSLNQENQIRLLSPNNDERSRERRFDDEKEETFDDEKEVGPRSITIDLKRMKTRPSDLEKGLAPLSPTTDMKTGPSNVEKGLGSLSSSTDMKTGPSNLEKGVGLLSPTTDMKTGPSNLEKGLGLLSPTSDMNIGPSNLEKGVGPLSPTTNMKIGPSNLEKGLGPLSPTTNVKAGPSNQEKTVEPLWGTIDLKRMKTEPSNLEKGVDPLSPATNMKAGPSNQEKTVEPLLGTIDLKRMKTEPSNLEKGAGPLSSTIDLKNMKALPSNQEKTLEPLYSTIDLKSMKTGPSNLEKGVDPLSPTTDMKRIKTGLSHQEKIVGPFSPNNERNRERFFDKENKVGPQSPTDMKRIKTGLSEQEKANMRPNHDEERMGEGLSNQEKGMSQLLRKLKVWFILCLCFSCCVNANIKTVDWNIQTYPMILGESVVLNCFHVNKETGTCRWTRSHRESIELLIWDKYSSNSSKFTRINPCSLAISALTIEDIEDFQYYCVIGTTSSSSQYLLDKKNTVVVPNEKEISIMKNNIEMNGSVFPGVTFTVEINGEAVKTLVARKTDSRFYHIFISYNFTKSYFGKPLELTARIYNTTFLVYNGTVPGNFIEEIQDMSSGYTAIVYYAVGGIAALAVAACIALVLWYIKKKGKKKKQGFFSIDKSLKDIQCYLLPKKDKHDTDQKKNME